jgi:phosphate-selective porin OprO/OprP
MKKLTAVLLVLLAGLGFAGVKARADESPKPTGEVQDNPPVVSASDLEILNNRLNALEKGSVVLTTEHNYLDIGTKNGDIVLKIGGTVQGDYRSYFLPSTTYDDGLPVGSSTYPEEGATAAAVNKSSSTFLDRKVRLDLVALFDQVVGLRYQAEFGATGYAIQDAYAFVKADPGFQFQLGKFKVPIGLERLQSDTDTLFAERALPTDLAPNRDLGAQITGTPIGFFNYALALTNGTPDNYTPNNADDQALTSGKEASGRIFLTPFKDGDSFLKNLGFGISGAWAWEVNWNSNALPNYFVTSLGQQQLFAYRAGVAPQGDFYHWSPQLYFSQGPFGLLGEYIQSVQDVGTSTATAVDLTHQAWQLAGSWVIGGKASYLGAVADTPLDLSKGHWGALEVAVRVHQLSIDPNAFNANHTLNLAATNSAQQATAFGAGLNWIFDPHFKLVFDWEETDFTEGTQVTPVVAGTVASLLPEDVFTVRAQANF